MSFRASRLARRANHAGRSTSARVSFDLTKLGPTGARVRSSVRWVRRSPTVFFVIALLVAAVLRVTIVFTDDGIYWPDEIYQSLEPAHRLVFGYGLIAWEFVQGARSWAMPGMIAGVFALADAIGLHAPAQYLGLTRLLFAAMAIGCAWGVRALALALGATQWAAVLAASAYGLCSLTLYFSHRAMSENASALTVVLGLWLLVANASRWRQLLGASLLGASVLLRLQCGLFCVVTLLWQLARRRYRVAAQTLAVFVGWAAILGWLDHLTWAQAPDARWGGWFHSALKYLDFNLVQGRAAAWGVSPWPYYLQTLRGAMPLLAPVIGLLALLAWRRATFVFVAALAFLVLHSMIPHKELRFVLPVLPLLFALAAAGLRALPAGLPRASGAALLLVSGAHALAQHRKLTFGDLGAYPDRPLASAWDDYGPVNRLLKIAFAQPDLCGLRVDAPTAWIGGYSYLHRNVPLYPPGFPPLSHHFNYGIVPDGSEGAVVAKSGAFALVRWGDVCTENAGYSWFLN